MRLAGFAMGGVVLFATGCGYVGPVLPPSPEIPAAITNLNAVERGDELVVTFTTPARTVDGVAITGFSALDLRIGPENQSPDDARSYDVSPPPRSDKDDPQAKDVSYKLDASAWLGQQIAVEVRASVKKTGHFSAWSNRSILKVIPPLAPPEVHAASSADGIVLTWQPDPDAQYKIARQGPDDKQPVDLATVNEPRYVDVSSQFDTAYTYTVTAVEGNAESLPSDAVTFSAVDKFPPAIPTGLTIVAGPDSVNVAWQRNAEPDFAGYYVFRSTDHGPYQKLGELVTLPNYVDRDVEHGKTYSYKISSIDKKSNESAESDPVEVQY